MKKKFFKGLMATVFVASLSFVSCDDASEDTYADLREEMIDADKYLEGVVNEQVEKMKKDLADLENAYKKDLQELENAYKNADDDLKDEVTSNLENEVGKLEDQIAALLARIEALEAEEDCTCDPNQPGQPGQDGVTPKLKIENGYWWVSYDDGNTWTQLEKATGEDGKDGQDGEDGKDGQDCVCPADVEQQLAKLFELNKIATEAIASLQHKQDSIVKSHNAIIAAHELLLNNHETAIANIKNDILLWDAKLQEVMQKVVDAQNKIAALENADKALEKQIKDNLDAANAYAESLKDQVLAELNKKFNAADGRIDNLQIALKDVEDAYKKAEKALQTQINNLTSSVADVENKLKKLEGAFNQYVSGILVQGAESPVFGFTALPFNLRSNILAAYYGEVKYNGTVIFPSNKYGNYADPDALVLTKKDLEMLNVANPWEGEGGDILVAEEGNAGTLYLTINPNTVDFENIPVTLENSLGEESAIKLGSLAYSDNRLAFGSARANKNGFYEVKATLNADDISSLKGRIDINDFAGELLANVGSGINLTDVVSKLGGQLNGTIDANAVKVSWKDDLGKERSVYSQYAIAATAFSPLSYKFAQGGLGITSLPGIDRIENLIGNVKDIAVNTFTDALNQFIPSAGTINSAFVKLDQILIDSLDARLSRLTIKADVPLNGVKIPLSDVQFQDINAKPGQSQIKITIPELKGTIDVSGTPCIGYTESKEIFVDAPNYTIEGDQIKLNDITINQTIKVNVPVNGHDLLKQLLGKEYPGSIGAIMDQVNALLVNKLDVIENKLNNAVDKVDNRISSALATFFDAFNAKFCGLINSANKVLQPVLLIEGTTGLNKVSQSISNPTVVTSGALNLIPTSYSSEYLAPAFKKLVGVTNVYSLDKTKNAQANGGEYLQKLQAAQTAEVLDGSVKFVQMNIEPGYIYEVVYTSMDYAGVVVANKFYVVCKN